MNKADTIADAEALADAAASLAVQEEAPLPPEGEFHIVSLNISERTGTRKKPVEAVFMVPGKGIEGDAHAGLIENRQVSLLAIEEIEKASEKLSSLARSGSCALAGTLDHLAPGDFAENITTRGIALHRLPIGTKLYIGSAVLEVSRIGKECHTACEIRRLVGDCVMPRKGIFARVLTGGEVHREDRGHYRV
jgi:MOSC domain-containing protein YiiM